MFTPRLNPAKQMMSYHKGTKGSGKPPMILASELCDMFNIKPAKFASLCAHNIDAPKGLKHYNPSRTYYNKTEAIKWLKAVLAKESNES